MDPTLQQCHLLADSVRGMHSTETESGSRDPNGKNAHMDHSGDAHLFGGRAPRRSHFPKSSATRDSPALLKGRILFEGTQKGE